MTNGVAVQVAAEGGRVAGHPRGVVMWLRPTTVVGGSSVASHCPAAAQPIRAYQRDHHRCSLTSAASWPDHPLDKSFHINNPR